MSDSEKIAALRRAIDLLVDAVERLADVADLNKYADEVIKSSISSIRKELSDF